MASWLQTKKLQRDTLLGNPSDYFYQVWEEIDLLCFSSCGWPLSWSPMEWTRSKCGFWAIGDHSTRKGTLRQFQCLCKSNCAAYFPIVVNSQLYQLPWSLFRFSERDIVLLLRTINLYSWCNTGIAHYKHLLGGIRVEKHFAVSWSSHTIPSTH